MFLSRGTFLIAAILLLFGCEKNQQGDQADRHTVLSESYLEIGQLKSALIEMKNALHAQPDHAKALHVGGLIFLKLGQLQDAERFLSKAKSLSPLPGDTAVQIHLDYARALIKTQKIPEALAIIDTLYQQPGVQPAPIHLVKGLALLAKDNIAQAKITFLETISQSPQSIDAYLGLAEIAFKEGNVETLNETLKKIEKINDVNVQLLLWQGKLAFIGEKYVEAQEYFSKALLQLNVVDTMTPEKFLALNGIVKSLMIQGKPEEAVRFNQMLENTPQGVFIAKYKEGLTAYLEGKFDDAEVMFQKLLKLNPDYAPTEAVLGAIKYANKEFEEAETYLKQALQRDGKYQDAQKLLALTQLNLKQSDNARETLSQLLEKNPEDANLKAYLILAFIQSNKMTEAEKLLAEAQKQHPKTPVLDLISGILYTNQKQWKKAAHHFEQVLSELPDHLLALKGLYISHAQMKSPAEALSVMKRFAEQTPQAIEAKIFLVQLYLKEKRMSEAKEIALRLYSHFPLVEKAKQTLSHVYFEQAQVLIKNNLWLPAKLEMEEALKVFPDDLTVYSGYIVLLHQLGEKTKAFQLIEDLKKKHAQSHIPFELEGDLLFKENQSAKGLEAYQRAWHYTQNEILALKYANAHLKTGSTPDVALKPIELWASEKFTVESATALSQAYLQVGAYPKAIQSLEKAVAKFPQDSSLLNNLAWSYFKNQDIRAEETAKMAVDQAPNNPYVLDTYGWILYQLGKLDLSAPYLEKAYKLAPKEPEIQSHYREVILAKSKTSKS